jgi:hypothetical protein
MRAWFLTAGVIAWAAPAPRGRLDEAGPRP